MKDYKKMIDKALELDPQLVRLKYIKDQQANPFNELPFEQDIFIDRSDITEDLIFEIGMAKHNIPKIIFITGTWGCGKTRFLLNIKKILNRLNKEDKKYYFQHRLFDVPFLFDEAEEEEDWDAEDEDWEDEEEDEDEE